MIGLISGVHQLIGLIKTYLPSKKYGFIKGKDGKDYFFHEDDFENKKDIPEISENSTIEFEEKATPKGYRAIKCSLVGNQELKYSIPDNFIASKKSGVKGFEIVEKGDWIIHGSSSNSPDEAKKEMIEHALNVGGNGVVDLTYYKTKGSRQGTGRGTYHFTIHNFKGRVVNFAKKDIDGKYDASEFNKINRNCDKDKKKLEELTSNSVVKSIFVWAICLISMLYLINNDMILMIIISIASGFIFGRYKKYGEWLEFKPVVRN